MHEIKPKPSMTKQGRPYLYVAPTQPDCVGCGVRIVSGAFWPLTNEGLPTHVHEEFCSLRCLEIDTDDCWSPDTDSLRCTWAQEMWGPHEGCAEFMDEPERIECDRPATTLLVWSDPHPQAPAGAFCDEHVEDPTLPEVAERIRLEPSDDWYRRCGACGETLHHEPRPDPLDDGVTLPADELGEFVDERGVHQLCHAECGMQRGWGLA